MKFFKFILLIFLFSCSKDNNVPNNSQDISIVINSIYNVENSYIAIFEGWVNPNSEDIKNDIKNFYSKYRGKGKNAKVNLTKGAYTIGVYNESLRQYKIEKIDLSNEPINVVFEFNERLKFNTNISSLFSSKAENTNLRFTGYFDSDLGVISNAYFNEIKLNNINTTDFYNYSFKSSNFGFNDLKIEYIYQDKSIDTKVYKIYTPEYNSIDEIFNKIDEDYVKQDIFNSRNFASLGKDTIINNVQYYANIIIDGLYGSYKFGFKNSKIDFIEVTHDNINRNSSYNFIDTKNHLDKVFGNISIRNSEQNYTYKQNGYSINLYRKSNADVVSVVVKE